MSNYFSQIPDFEYVSRLPNAKISDYINVKNLFKRVFLREDIYQNLTFFKKYSVVGDDRPDNVAAQVYEDSNLDWLILLANNIVNITNEWPLGQNEFNRYLLDKYDNDYDKIYNGVHHYETIEVKDSNDIVIVPKGLNVSEDFSTTYYDYFIGGLTTANNITRPITNFQYEEKIEDDKRNIFLLKPLYISLVIDDLSEMMKYKKGSTEYISKSLKKAENIRLYQ